ncbi:UNVERIFIED_CONTAM: hypothetical protein GTU68_053567 [Idotea baltica]|nr:hypothetical protein [Idotea baltica]
MIHVVLALQLCYVFGAYNIGHQHFIALGEHLGFLEGIHLKLIYGLLQLIPIFIVTNVVGLGIEFLFAAKRGHGIQEGFLVSGALIPLIMPPDIPLWILAMGVAFAVVIGKEAFGGTGMNILNIALLARVFVFFAYPLTISGDEVWVSVDGYTGATPLALAYQGGWDNVLTTYSESQMFWGAIPGSIGETCKPAIIFGAFFLITVGIGSWRIMLSALIGAAVGGMLLNAWGATPFMTVPWVYQFYMGSFFFAAVYMATDPVTAASTMKGKIIYGFLIGVIGMIIRVLNPAYPEGWMLAILFLNVFAPLIDYFVLDSHISKRLKRA